jgi:tetratricopeptide (TPR) repeat protein
MTLIFAIPLAVGLTLGASVASAQRVGLAEIDRETALTHLRAGQAALATERYDVAEREFREAIRLDPRLELAHYGLGQVFMATKRYDHAVDAFVSCRNLFQANLTENQDQRLMYERRLDDQIQSKRDELRASASSSVSDSAAVNRLGRCRHSS